MSNERKDDCIRKDVEPPLSRKKLTAYIKQAKMDMTNVTNEKMYLYGTGRNLLADNILVALLFGEFDEDKQ